MRADIHADSGGIVVGWLVKLVVVLAVFGVLGIDGAAVLVAHVNGTDDANNAAAAAEQAWQNNHNYASAVQAAEDAVTNTSESLVSHSLVIDDSGTVHLKLRREITTTVLRHIGPLKKYTVVVIDGEATPPTS